MNFYKELEQEFKRAGLEGKVVPVPEELKPTKEDFSKINRNLEIRLRDVDTMLCMSIIYAKNSLPVGNEPLIQSKSKKLVYKKGE